jgi:hypothetical protein
MIDEKTTSTTMTTERMITITTLITTTTGKTSNAINHNINDTTRSQGSSQNSGDDES